MANRTTVIKEKIDVEIKKILLYLYPKCPFCGDPSVDPHHFLKKRNNTKYRFDLRNLFPPCRKCHTLAEDGIISYEIVKKKAIEIGILTEEEAEEICNDNSNNKYHYHELVDLFEEIREKRKNLGIL